MAVYKVPVLGTFSWQPPVKAIQNDPPGSPVKGDRYLVAGSPTGAWVGNAWRVATYNGTGWDFDIPAEGWAAWDEGANNYKYFNGTAWTSMIPPTPTGTGFRKVVAGVEDAAAKLVENAEVHASAAIAESKLALNYATHSPANDPSAGEKAALPGTSGTPSGTNKYVTNDDSRNTNARTPVAHEHAGADISSGTLDGDRLPALSATKKGGAPATGTPTGKYLKDDGTWATPGAGGDMTKAVYDTDADNIVDKAEAVDDGAGNATTAAQVKEAYTKRAVYDADYKCLTFTI